MLGLSQAEIAAKDELTEDLLRIIETDGSNPEASLLVAVQQVLEEAGIEFISGNQPGVRLKRHEPENPFVRAGVQIHSR
jgi:transcriptional regulator with XRE-family HTH domain